MIADWFLFSANVLRLRRDRESGRRARTYTSRAAQALVACSLR